MTRKNKKENTDFPNFKIMITNLSGALKYIFPLFLDPHILNPALGDHIMYQQSPLPLLTLYLAQQATAWKRRVCCRYFQGSVL